MLEVKDGEINVYNHNKDPIIVYKSEPICNIHAEQPHKLTPESNTRPIEIIRNTSVKPKSLLNSSAVVLNPDNILNKDEENSFKSVMNTFDDVFSPVTGTYNGHSGQCYVKVNIGPNPPPQTKGRVPFYGDGGLQELQNHFDDLESRGIVSRPEEIGVTVENIHPSFLVNKPPPSTKKRLVTDFKSIANYCRPCPSLLPDVETTI